jgi:fluoride exporter
VTFVAAVVASGLGALARHVLASLVMRRTSGRQPWGTATVNLVGAVALGVIAGLHGVERIGADVLTVVGAGFLGGFTTFSTWMVESVRLGERGGSGALLALAVNSAGLLVAGVAGAAIGTALV